MNVVGRTLSLLSRGDGPRLKIFISYRRLHDSHVARQLKRELTRAFGRGAVFRDRDDIAPGDAFPEAIRRAVESCPEAIRRAAESCDVFVAVVSPGWLEASARLRDPEDFVRREMAAALARRVALVPVLAGGARMPAADELARGGARLRLAAGA